MTKELAATWVRIDRYTYLLGGKGLRRRLHAVWRLLVTGMIKIEWFVPATKKDKRLILVGKREV